MGSAATGTRALAAERDGSTFAAQLRGRAKVSLTSTAWAPHAELPPEEWVAQGRRLGSIGRAVGWWIGDWLRYGNERFGERYVRASRITGYDVQTLMNMVWVASRFEPHRRRDGLSFSHHAEVAALEPAAQEHWLSLSEENRLSVRCLREELRRARGAERKELERTAAAAHEVVCPECGCRFERESKDEASRMIAGGKSA